MSLNNRISKLHQRRRKEVAKINKKYRKLISQAKSECVDHDFSKWDFETDHNGMIKTSFKGHLIECRTCKLCTSTQRKKISKLRGTCYAVEKKSHNTNNEIVQMG